MEPGAAAPLLDLFRKGGVDRDMRLLAAQGGLGLRRFEQIGVCELLVNDEDTEVAQAASALLQLLQSEPVESSTVVDPAGADEEKAGTGTALQKIAAMTPGQRLALAMKGTREERAILVRDPNRIVAVAVLIISGWLGGHLVHVLGVTQPGHIAEGESELARHDRLHPRT